MNNSDSQKIIHIHLPKEESFKTTLNAGNHSMVADEPLSVEGGKDLGPDPYDYLLMSLGACTTMTIKMYAQRKGWELDDIFIELRHNKRHADDCIGAEEPGSKIDFIEKEVIIKGELTREQKEKLLEISKKCPVHRTLLSEINIESSLVSS
ncbi:MAG: OsmC family protein [Balneolales bacterium]|nr:OsmC family protein [Balneolales bacterium]